MKAQRYTFIVEPEFPSSKRWVVTVKDNSNKVKGRVIGDNKIGLLDALNQALPEDDDTLDIDFEEN